MNIIPRSAKAGALLFFANYKLDRIVKNETIDYSLSYMLGRNESSCVVFHVYSFYPNYSEYEIKERLRIFMESIFKTKNENKLIKYLNINGEDEFIRTILKGCTKTSVEKLYEFLNAEKRMRIPDTSPLGLLKTFTFLKN